jgi:predicted Zn-dependent protease
MTYLVGYYKQRFGLAIQTLPAIALDSCTFNPTRQQNQVEGLIASLERSHPTLANDGRSILIGITEADVCTTSENWVFALGQRDKGRFAVVSSARMDLDHFDYGVPRDPVALHSRLTKMISREIGFLYYALPFSPDQRSVVRSSIMGVDELDEIGEDF